MPAVKFNHRAPLPEAARTLAASNIGLARKLAFELATKYNFEYDDAFQIASIGLLRACRTYDSTKAKLSVHVYIHIRSFAKNWVRDHTRKSSIGALSLDAPLADKTAFVDYIPSHYREFAGIEYDYLYQAIDRLPENQRRVILYRIEDRTCKEIAVILGMSLQNVSRLANHAKENLRKILEESNGESD